MNFKTVNDLNTEICKSLYKIPKDVDLVVGIPRSGMLAASMLALYLNLPLSDFDSLINGKVMSCGRCKVKDNWIASIAEARKILIVEDSSSTGKSIKDAKQQLKKFQYSDKIVFLTVYVTERTKLLSDLYLEICEVPRMFEWNYLHHSRLDLACFDIDGVLCEDPTEEQNDDGEKYRDFIRNAPLRVAPTSKIGYLVTSRLEKYREDTEYWLNKNNIKYDNLIMMQFATKEERIQSGSYGIFKGEHYKRLKISYLFVESDKRQASEIAKVSGKTVFCTENQRVYEQSSSVKVKENAIRKVKKLIPSRLKNMIKKAMR